MPNTPALVGEGMTAICDDTTFSQEDFDFAKGIFDAVGKTKVLPERLFDGVVAVSGSSPAYVYMMIEAMADAGVREGLPRSYAYEMAAQSVLGSALMVLSSGTHPAALKDAVCSPAGTTIEAVAALEKNGFRNAVMEAMKACAEKSREMSKSKERNDMEDNQKTVKSIRTAPAAAIPARGAGPPFWNSVPHRRKSPDTWPEPPITGWSSLLRSADWAR